MPVQIETLQSDYLQAEVPFAVILPAGDGPFPVLYDLHGLMRWEGPYDPAPTKRTFFETATTPFKRETVIGGQAYASIEAWANEQGVVLVKVNGGAGWYLDSPRIKNSQYESHFIKEVIPHVESVFPSIGKKQQAATQLLPIIGTSETRGISGLARSACSAVIRNYFQSDRSTAPRFALCRRTIIAKATSKH